MVSDTKKNFITNYFFVNIALYLIQNKRMNGIKEHIPHLFYQFVNCIQHIVIV